MSLEERINYYNFYLEDNGLPENVSYSEFFDMEMLSFLSEEMVLNISSNDWIELFKVYTDNQQYMDKLIELFCQKGSCITQKDFNAMIQDNDIAVRFMNSFVKYIQVTNFAKEGSIALIFNNDNLLNQIFNNKIISISNFINIFKNHSLSKESALKLLCDRRFLDIFFNYNAYDFFSVIKDKNIELELADLIQMKIESLSYEEKIKLVSNRIFYDPQNGKPAYLKELYSTFENRINLNKKREKILNLKENSSLDDKELVKSFINTSDGLEVFLKELLEPQFSNLIRILNLDVSFYQKRKDILFNELNNYTKYDMKTVRDLLCVYCFGDKCSNVILRLKILIQYANESENALLLLKDDIQYLIKLYSYLTFDNIDINPLDLISEVDINDLIRKVHNLFSDEINKKTDISDILNSDNYKEKNGVKVIDTEIPLDRSYFLVHSVSIKNIAENQLQNYLNMASKHNRICISVLDNNHTNTFLDGIVFGYCNIEAPMYSAVPFDGQTNQRVYGINYMGRPQFRSVLTSVDKFMKKTTWKYNELTYMTDNKVIMPSYIFVANREPSEIEFKVAKEFDIPILLYHTKSIDYEFENNDDKPELFDYEELAIDYIPNESYKKLHKS